jgi:DNA invertase Pin-like site-specific DNA recombinase
MTTSELVTREHLSRLAIVYVRQSTPQQAINHQESLKLQYALRERAKELGWREADIETIDCDLGISGSSAESRQGFKDLVTKVTLGQVGLVLSYEVTRLSRNCSDWYQLLDICGLRRCLIADRDGVYDPSSANGRLLLGLKGQISELELHTIRGRLMAGLQQKAQRGDLCQKLPVGFVRNSQGKVEKHPDREVQGRIQLVFDTFLRLRSIGKTLRHFATNDLTLPRQNRFGDITWKSPTDSAIGSMLRNPAYAGIFAYGRSRVVYKDTKSQGQVKRLPEDQWQAKVTGKYPIYVAPDDFARIQEILRENYAEYERRSSRGIARRGQALLHGLVYCGVCGHKMTISYSSRAYYVCNRLKIRYASGDCQLIPVDPIDKQVTQAFLEALSPVELDLYLEATKERQHLQEQASRARLDQLARLRYQATLAERQFNQVDPDNRLVAAELERRWESALLALKHAERQHEEEQARHTDTPTIISQKLKQAFSQLGRTLPKAWNDDGVLTQEHRKALLRCLVDKVVMRRVAGDHINVRIVWKGGDVSSLDVATPSKTFRGISHLVEMEAKITSGFQAGRSDDEIAQALTAEGYRSPLEEEVLPATVKKLRLQRGLKRNGQQSLPRNVAGYLTVNQLAASVGVPINWVYARLREGRIAAEHRKNGRYLFPDDGTIIEKCHEIMKNLRRNRSVRASETHFSEEYQDA